jgi:hypothetical protein
MALSKITTESLLDGEITLPKLSSGTDGNIISYDASGNPVAVATGNDGQVLTSTGAGSPPAFEDAAGGGAWNFISAIVASNASSVDFESGFDDTYDAYMIVGTSIIMHSDGASLQLRTGTGGTPSYATTAYLDHCNESHSASDAYDGYNNSGDAITLIRELGTGSGEGAKYVCVTFADPDATTIKHLFNSVGAGINSNGRVVYGYSIGSPMSTTAITGVRFLGNSGNITGTFRMYGLAKS